MNSTKYNFSYRNKKKKKNYRSYKNKYRKYFYYGGKKDNIIAAIGVLFYIKINHEIKILYRYSNGYVGDIGGKIDIEDYTIVDTLMREVSEETNSKLFSNKHKKEDCIKCLFNIMCKKKYKVIFNKGRKYLLFIQELHPWINNLSLKRFGYYEEGGSNHFFFWGSNGLNVKNLNPRLATIKDEIEDILFE